MDDWLDAHQLAEIARERAAMVDGKHYTEHVAEVKALRRSGDDDAAAGILLRLIDAIEREASIPLAGAIHIAPWYFRELDKIYRKAGANAASGQLMHRFVVLQAQAETSGIEAMQRMKAQIPREPAPPVRRPNPELKSAAFGLGQLVGRLLRRR